MTKRRSSPKSKRKGQTLDFVKGLWYTMIVGIRPLLAFFIFCSLTRQNDTYVRLSKQRRTKCVNQQKVVTVVSLNNGVAQAVIVQCQAESKKVSKPIGGQPPTTTRKPIKCVNSNTASSNNSKSKSWKL